MLALMPVDTMSLAILPSHTPVSRPTAPTKRPKLSLNTASLPSTFGKSTTGLRLDAPSIASPTARNTFSNAYGSQHVTSPEATTPHQDVRPKSRLCLDTSVAPTHQHSARSSSTDSCMSATSATSASTESSISSTSTTDSFDKPIPYRLPFNHHSILTNGPHGCLRRRKSFSSTRPMFPSPKNVSFRAPLTEDIHNTIYTLAHSDIDFTSPSPLRRPTAKTQTSSSSPPNSHTHLTRVWRQTRHLLRRRLRQRYLPINAHHTQKQKTSRVGLDIRSHQPNHTTTLFKPHRRSKSIMTPMSLQHKPSRPTYESPRKKHAFLKIALAMGGAWLFLLFFYSSFLVFARNCRLVLVLVFDSSSSSNLSGYFFFSSILFLLCPSIDTPKSSFARLFLSSSSFLPLLYLFTPNPFCFSVDFSCIWYLRS
jgi:hypothetical protein